MTGTKGNFTASDRKSPEFYNPEAEGEEDNLPEIGADIWHLMVIKMSQER